MRYQLLPYLYTAFQQAAVSGMPVARPLYFGFPDDDAARSNDRQWLLGDSLLVSPVLEPGQNQVGGVCGRE